MRAGSPDWLYSTTWAWQEASIRGRNWVPIAISIAPTVCDEMLIPMFASRLKFQFAVAARRNIRLSDSQAALFLSKMVSGRKETPTL